MQYLFYYLFKYVFYLIISAVFIAVVLGILSPFDFFTRYNFMVISSGSMEPSIPMGDLVLVDTKISEIRKNDVITFKDPQGGRFFFTHRIENIFEDNNGEYFIETKGDANDSIDNWQLLPQDIYGSVKMAFPLVGYILEFTKTFAGFVILIIIPAVVIMANELAKIKLYLHKIEYF